MKKILCILMSVFLIVCVININEIDILAYDELSTISEESFVEYIKSINNKNGNSNVEVLTTSNDDGVISVYVDNKDGSFTIYSTLSDEEQAMFNAMPTNKLRSIGFTVFKTLVNIVKVVVKAGKWICKIVKYITKENVCAKIGMEMLKSMVPEVEYVATSYLKKDPNCVPPHSAHCNSYPNAYWETKVVRKK